MSRNMAGVYTLPAGSTIANGDLSDATDLNGPLADIEADLNVVRPIVAGGTGASTAAGAVTALGFTATAADISAAAAGLSGLTATAAELNILDGATVTTAELNILDGATLTVTELNYVDGVTSAIQTQLNAKAALASPTFTGTPAAPTAAVGTNTTQVATTAFVRAELLDEDNFATNSATRPPSQQSTKAYVDAAVAAVGGGGWEPFNGTDGIVYSHAVTGNVADVESAALDDGYEYLAIYDGISVSAGTIDFNIALYRDTSAAYAGDIPLGAVGLGSSGFSYIMAPRVTAKQHAVQSQFLADSTNATTLAAITAYSVQHTTRQKIGKFRWRFSSNNIDAGIIYLYRRAFTA